MEFYKLNPNDKIWWVDNPEYLGIRLFTFDKKKIYTFYRDYPEKLSDEELRIFNEEFPVLAKMQGGIEYEQKRLRDKNSRGQH